MKAIGVELSPREAKKATEEVKKHHLQASVRVIQGNMLQQDLSPADVVTLYLTTSANESIRPNLERYLKNNARVVSYDYPIPGWRPVSEVETESQPTRDHAHDLPLPSTEFLQIAGPVDSPPSMSWASA